MKLPAFAPPEAAVSPRNPPPQSKRNTPRPASLRFCDSRAQSINCFLLFGHRILILYPLSVGAVAGLKFLA